MSVILILAVKVRRTFWIGTRYGVATLKLVPQAMTLYFSNALPLLIPDKMVPLR